MDLEGNSYERAAIEKWLEQHDTSPITRSPLKRSDLVPNRALKDSIDASRSSIKTDQPKNPYKFQLWNTGEKIDTEPLQLSLSTGQADNVNFVKVSVVAPEGKAPTPTAVCCVVDVSGLTQLDVVKHALKTVASSLRPIDQMALVTFSDKARVEFKLMIMTEANKKRALDIIDKLDIEGITNLWAGLLQGLEIMAESANADANNSVWVFTDGQPNVHPPRGELAALKLHLDSQNFRCQVNTFGFGYSLDSRMLWSLADETQGTFAFIPDGSMVGTIFVNALANQLTTITQNAVLNVEPASGVKIDHHDGMSLYTVSNFGSDGAFQTPIGPVHYGQTRDFIIPFSHSGKVPASPVTVTVEFDDIRAVTLKKPHKFQLRSSKIQTNDPFFQSEYVRLSMVSAIHKATNCENVEIQIRQKTVEDMISKVSTLSIPDSAYVQDLWKDIKGQTSQAVSRADWFDKWGKHYLPSLCRAHFLQICNNFKGPGVQHYGGTLFKKLQNTIETVFNKIPPPKPSTPRHDGDPGQRQPSITSMSVYYSSVNPCFDGNCFITLQSGETKKVNKLCKGDLVKSPSGEPAQVVCVVKTDVSSGPVDMVNFENGLSITPYHPIRVNGEWRFPMQLQQINGKSQEIYSLILDSEQIVYINGIECVCLGHGYGADVPIVGHCYFGERIVEDLKICHGWDRGLIEMKPDWLIRDVDHQVVIGMDWSQEVVVEVVDDLARKEITWNHSCLHV
ncbi:hint-domain-containing protein [Paraphysoderma sedebokerense]|nr:hint-domain-containing protein [Paraphysoderma sedebokerense]